MKRKLNSEEIAEARKVFGDVLDYQRVSVYEEWTRFRFIRWGHTAFGLGNSVRFPRRIDVSPQDRAWLIHELTHVWQFQKQGWVYLWKALRAQREQDPYNYGGEELLLLAREKGFTIHDFTVEQQGEITRHYYYLLQIGADTKAWEPFIEDIRRS